MTEFDLNKDPKINSGFKTPDNYFEEFSKRMLEKLAEQENKVIPISRKSKNWVYAAAAILIVALSIPIYQNLNKPAIEIDSLTLENYLSSRNTITDRDFAELLDEKDIKQIRINSDIEVDTLEDLLSTDSNLEEYLTN